MWKNTLLRTTTLCLSLLLLSACTPNLPTAVPPTQDATLVAVAAEATVTAMARAQAPGPAPTEAQAQTNTAPAPAITATDTAVPPSEFWVVYLEKNKLATINGDGTKKILLTNTPGKDYRPAWSPDGKTLAFLRFDGNSRTDGILHLLPAGSDTPRILDGARDYNQFTWTPGGTQLLATRGISGMYEVYLLETSGGQPFQVATEVTEFPSLSPDGKQIALLVNKKITCNGKGCAQPNNLYIYDISTRQMTRLTSDDLPKMAVSWSPDGQQIAYVLADVSEEKVEIVRPDGKLIGSRQPLPWWTAQWVRSPDGSQIAFFDNDPANSATEIFLLPSSGTANSGSASSGSAEPRKVTRLEKSGEMAAYIDTLRWRSDGSGFVFNMWTELYTINLDGSGLRGLPVKMENVFFDVRPADGDYAPPPAPTAPATWKLCPGGLDSRLDVGRQAQVTTDPPTPNNVRQGPLKTTKLVGQIQPGEKVEITGGPICDKGLIWWEIRSLGGGIKGYTLEGDLKTYWLVPVP